ncbi:ice-binding family protein [Nocardioides bigeumensis]|uniref:DUF3494 domain-containing protein n=1 Tax=Nocardioides bigeumensis TaxID=433657 RepID=A0ABN2YN03_9ACTN
MFRDHLTMPSRPAGALGLVSVVLLTVGLAGSPAQAAEATVDLGSADSFAVLAGESITNTGTSVITGDVGVGPGSSITSVPPLVMVGGAIHVADAVANLAQSDLVSAYNSAAGRPTVTDVTGSDLGGMTLTSGVVEHTSGMHLTGTVTLDAQGDPAAVFIFKAGSTLVTAPDSTVSLINGASPCNVFWQVGSSATLDTNTTFVGTIMALTSATLATGASVQGRVLARNGSVTLDTNVITRPGCATVVNPSSSPSSTVPATATASAAPSASASPKPPKSSSSGHPHPSATPTSTVPGGGGGSGGGGGDGSGGGSDTPTIPVGHPATGLGSGSSPGLPVPAILVLLGAVAALGASLSLRRPRPARQH